MLLEHVPFCPASQSYVPLKAMKQVCGITAAAGPKVAAECGMHLEAVGVGLERRRVEASGDEALKGP